MYRAFAVSSITCISLVSCSAIFTSQEQDASTVNPDGPCEGTQFLSQQTGLGISSSQVIDLNGDDLDEVVIFSQPSRGGRSVYIHDGRCPHTSTWNYQFEWLPMGPQSEVTPDVLAVVPDAQKPGERIVVAMGEQGGNGYLGTFALLSKTEDAISIASDPDVHRLLPPYLSTTCKEAKGPYLVVAADLDNDQAGVRDDLAFSAGQGWLYEVDDWSDPAPWTADCVDDTESGEIPDQHEGPGLRFGFSVLPPKGANGDEIMVTRPTLISWIYDFGDQTQKTSWPVNEVDGAALSRYVEADDEKVDAVGWLNPTGPSNTLSLIKASLGPRSAHQALFEEVEVDLMSAAAPTAGHLLPDGRLLLLVESTLYLIDLEGTALEVDQQNFNYPPLFFLVPQAVADQPSRVLTFNSNSGEHQCHIVEGDTFAPCPLAESN